MEPRIQYAQTIDGVSIACYALGSPLRISRCAMWWPPEGVDRLVV
jgi:hypothetical protein